MPCAGDVDGELATGPDPVPDTGWREGRTLREIAVELFGAERVDAEWHADSWMRGRVRRHVRRACAAAGDGGLG